MFLVLILTTLKTSLQNVLISTDKTDNDEDFLYLFLDDVDGYINEKHRIKYLVFASTGKKKKY